MNFVPVELEPWNPLWLTIPVVGGALLIVFAIVIASILEHFNCDRAAEFLSRFFSVVGIVTIIFGSIYTFALGSTGWDSDQKIQALRSDGMTNVSQTDSGWVASDDGKFVRIEFLTVDDQQGYTVISDGEDD